MVRVKMEKIVALLEETFMSSFSLSMMHCDALKLLMTNNLKQHQHHFETMSAQSFRKM